MNKNMNTNYLTGHNLYSKLSDAIGEVAQLAEQRTHNPLLRKKQSKKSTKILWIFFF